MNPENHLVELVESRKENEQEENQEFCKVEFIHSAFDFFMGQVALGRKIGFDYSANSESITVFNYETGRIIYLSSTTPYENMSNKEYLEDFKQTITKGN